MKDKTKNILKIALVMLLLAGLGIAACLKPDESQDYNERRKLRQFPTLNLDTILSGKFEQQLEPYLLDQAAFRSQLLDLRSLSAKYLFGYTSDNGIVQYNGHLVSASQQLDTGSIDYACSLISKIYDTCLKDSQCQGYYSIVPDKSYFLQDAGFGILDYAAMFAAIEEGMPSALHYIDIADSLTLDDYYHSDSHWKQESIVDTAALLAKGMGVQIDTDYTLKTALENFQGVYAGQSAWSYTKDSLQYLESEDMKDWTVTLYEGSQTKTMPVYNFEELTAMDPYAFFLSGNPGLLKIENPHASTQKELILFRDSYGSSIAPLLADGYASVTLVDLRNLPSFSLQQYINFTNQDVLFLFSTSVFNAAWNLK